MALFLMISNVGVFYDGVFFSHVRSTLHELLKRSSAKGSRDGEQLGASCTYPWHTARPRASRCRRMACGLRRNSFNRGRPY